MAEQSRVPIRVLVVDDEAEVRDAYRQILLEAEVSRDLAAFRDCAAALFEKRRVPAPAVPAAPARRDLRSGVLRRRRSRGRRGQGGARAGTAVRRGVSRHAHAAGSRWRLGGGAHPGARSGDRDRHLHCLFGCRPMRNRRHRAAGRETVVSAETVSSARSAADGHRARQQMACGAHASSSWPISMR